MTARDSLVGEEKKRKCTRVKMLLIYVAVCDNLINRKYLQSYELIKYL